MVALLMNSVIIINKFWKSQWNNYQKIGWINNKKIDPNLSISFKPLPEDDPLKEIKLATTS